MNYLTVRLHPQGKGAEYVICIDGSYTYIPVTRQALVRDAEKILHIANELERNAPSAEAP